jgi:uncharacterized protein YndB with AHSA1/START domain
MTYAIKQLFHINAPREKVFKAISSIEGLAGWWTVQTSGSTATSHIIQFRFGNMGGPDMKVVQSIPNEKVEWECVESQHGWIGHRLSFLLDDNDGKTRVRFAHDGWMEQEDFYAICSFTWGRYMESLRQLCQTGKGEAFGSEGFRQ